MKLQKKPKTIMIGTRLNYFRILKRLEIGSTPWASRTATIYFELRLQRELNPRYYECKCRCLPLYCRYMYILKSIMPCHGRHIMESGYQIHVTGYEIERLLFWLVSKIIMNIFSGYCTLLCFKNQFPHVLQYLILSSTLSTMTLFY
jgi:hypothetical protein